MKNLRKIFVLVAVLQMNSSCKAKVLDDQLGGVRYESALQSTELGPLFTFAIYNTGYKSGICFRHKSFPFLNSNAASLFNVYTDLGEPVISYQPVMLTVDDGEASPFDLRLNQGEALEFTYQLSHHFKIENDRGIRVLYATAFTNCEDPESVEFVEVFNELSRSKRRVH